MSDPLDMPTPTKIPLGSEPLTGVVYEVTCLADAEGECADTDLDAALSLNAAERLCCEFVSAPVSQLQWYSNSLPSGKIAFFTAQLGKASFMASPRRVH